MNSHIAVTGANGFIGNYIVKSLINKGLPVKAIFRNNRYIPKYIKENYHCVGEINESTDWSSSLYGGSHTFPPTALPVTSTFFVMASKIFHQQFFSFFCLSQTFSKIVYNFLYEFCPCSPKV